MNHEMVDDQKITLKLIKNQDLTSLIKTQSIQKSKALNLMTKLNIPYSLEKPSTEKNDGYVWNGQNFKLGCTKTSSHIVHEVAHYLVTPIEYRQVPEFGLGSSPDGDQPIDTVRPLDRQDTEELASVLGILIEYYLGLPAKETFFDHSWYELGSEKKFNTTIKKLKKLNYINQDNIPYCCL